ncbi:11307_t:CDS:1, partial [Funneliformis mosseae]
DLIDQLAKDIYKDSIFVKEYLQYKKEENIHQMITDEEILKFLKEPEEDIEEEVEVPIIGNYETLAALEKIIMYVKQKAEKIQFQKDQIRAIKKLRKAIEREEFCSKQ